MTDPIEEARALLAKATPGPWKSHPCSGETHADELYGADGKYLGAVIQQRRKFDLYLIAAAPRLLAALVAEVERLTAERDAARREAVDHASDADAVRMAAGIVARERDARPEITPELAAAWLGDAPAEGDAMFRGWIQIDSELRRALREHAAKAKP